MMKELNPMQVNYRHFRTPCGDITVAYRVDKRIGVFELGYAACNPKDQFSKKEGRLRAGIRLRSGGFRLEFQNNPGLLVDDNILSTLLYAHATDYGSLGVPVYGKRLLEKAIAVVLCHNALSTVDE